METSEKKKPNYTMVGLIAVLLLVFSAGQWMVVRALDARVGNLEATMINAVGRCATPADLTTSMRRKHADMQARAVVPPPSPAAAPSGAPAAASSVAARK